MFIPSHWRKEQYRVITEQYNWENVENNGKVVEWAWTCTLTQLVKNHHRLPIDAQSVARRKRDVALASAIVTVVGGLLAFHYGSPTQWNHFASFVKQHPMVLAAPITAIVLVAIRVLASKKAQVDQEIASTLMVAALVALVAVTLHMESPSSLKYVLNNPQLMEMSLSGYAIVRLTHHFVSKKKSGDIDQEVEARYDKLEFKGSNRDKKLAEIRRKIQLERTRYTQNAGLLSAAALIGVVALGLIGWQGAYGKIGDFMSHNWQDILKLSGGSVLGLGMLGAICWAAKRGEQPEVREVRLLTELEQALEPLEKKFHNINERRQLELFKEFVLKFESNSEFKELAKKAINNAQGLEPSIPMITDTLWDDYQNTVQAKHKDNPKVALQIVLEVSKIIEKPLNRAFQYAEIIGSIDPDNIGEEAYPKLSHAVKDFKIEEGSIDDELRAEIQRYAFTHDLLGSKQCWELQLKVAVYEGDTTAAECIRSIIESMQDA